MNEAQKVQTGTSVIYSERTYRVLSLEVPAETDYKGREVGSRQTVQATQHPPAGASSYLTELTVYIDEETGLLVTDIQKFERWIRSEETR